MDRTICAIDVGTTKMCTLVGATQGEGPLHIIGVGIVPSRGVEKGSIVDMEDATNSIAASVRDAEQRSGLKIEHAVVGISGVHIAGVNSRGVATVARPARGVTKEDIDNALESAQNIAISYSYEILHTISRAFTLDDQDGIHNPLGMYGQRLEVDAHLVTGSASADATLVKCVKGAGVEVENLVVESLASGEAVLTSEERESGVVLVDIGGGTTDVAVFLGGSMWHSAVIGRGGYLVTKDLVQILQMPFHQAELLKLQCGHADSSDISEGEMVEIAGFGDQPRRSIPRRLVAQIIEARLEQIFSQVGEEIIRSGYSGLLPAGVVLCGGTAQMGGIRSLAKRMLGLPVRIGAPQGMRGYVEAVSNPAYACSVGLLNWGLAYGQSAAGGNEGGGRPPSGGNGGGIVEWLRRFLPG